MYRNRIIPVLLLKDKGLVKSVRFKDHRYIGDPLNAARIYNEARADELIFLDIDASREKRSISIDFVNSVAGEVSIPFAVGGGIRTLDQIREVVKAGVERVVLGTVAVEDPDFVRQAALEFGSSTLSVCIDVRNDFFGRERVVSNGAKHASRFRPVQFAQLMEASGAGEIIVQSVEQDGLMLGYDLDLMRMVSEAVSIPVVALGGAGRESDLRDAVKIGAASAAAAGSLFVYYGTHHGVLINYPQRKSISKITAHQSISVGA